MQRIFFVNVFRQHLNRRGIRVHGISKDLDDGNSWPNFDSLVLVARHLSDPLADLAAITNKDSHNLYAEHILRAIGVHNPVTDDRHEPGSADMGLVAALNTFAEAGADTNRLQLVDGSGLSRRNLVSPRMVGALLKYMAAHENPRVRQTFKASLAVGGLDGTLEYRYPEGAAARGRVFAKTGTIGNVSALAGYVTTTSEQEFAFVIFSNHFMAPYNAIRDLQDEIVNYLANSH